MKFRAALFSTPFLVGISFGAALAATTCSTVAACIFGNNASSGIGVEGTSKSGHGMQGSSASGFGVVGITNARPTGPSAAKAGVEGLDNSGYSYNSGVYGYSQSGRGVYGVSTLGYGIYGASISPSNASQGGAGVFGIADGPAETAIIAASGGTAHLLTGTSLTSPHGGHTDVFSFDAFGNEILAGSLTTHGSPYVVTKSASGPDVAYYGASTSSPTLEDFGKAPLRRGAAYVALEPTFASTIDRTNYMVFVTPEGDSRGLYTTQTANGFQVRENGDGRSFLTFDYRIVAKPLDTNAMRLPAMSVFPQLKHRVLQPQVP